MEATLKDLKVTLLIEVNLRLLQIRVRTDNHDVSHRVAEFSKYSKPLLVQGDEAPRYGLVIC